MSLHDRFSVAMIVALVGLGCFATKGIRRVHEVLTTETPAHNTITLTGDEPQTASIGTAPVETGIALSVQHSEPWFHRDDATCPLCGGKTRSSIVRVADRSSAIWFDDHAGAASGLVFEGCLNCLGTALSDYARITSRSLVRRGP